MPTIKYKPTTPARRHMSVPSFEEITKFTPEKSLLATKKKVLVVLSEKDEKVEGSFANIPGVKVAFTNTINVYDILNCDSFIVAKAAAEKIEEVYAS